MKTYEQLKAELPEKLSKLADEAQKNRLNNKRIKPLHEMYHIFLSKCLSSSARELLKFSPEARELLFLSQQFIDKYTVKNKKRLIE